MKNLWLVICQILLSLVTLVCGVVFARTVFGNGIVTVVVISIIFLFDVVFPFIWFADLTEERTRVDHFFIFGQVLWHILLGSVLCKYGIFPTDAVDLSIAGVSLLALFGLRYTVQDSFLKQER